MVCSGEEIEYPLGVLKSEAIKSKILLIFQSTLILQRVIALSSEASHSDCQMYPIEMLWYTIEMLDMCSV